MVDSPFVARIAALCDEQLRIRATLGRGGLWRQNDKVDRLDAIATALHELWELRRREDALRRAGGRASCLGPTDARAHRSRRIV